MIVTRMAMTPSLNASRRPRFMPPVSHRFEVCNWFPRALSGTSLAEARRLAGARALPASVWFAGRCVETDAAPALAQRDGPRRAWALRTQAARDALDYGARKTGLVTPTKWLEWSHEIFIRLRVNQMPEVLAKIVLCATTKWCLVGNQLRMPVVAWVITVSVPSVRLMSFVPMTLWVNSLSFT